MVLDHIKRMIKKVLLLFIVYGLSFCYTIPILILLGFKYLQHGSEIFKKKDRTVPPPAILDEKWGTHQYITLKKQGIKLHYVEKGDRNKPLLLCLHGFPECWLSYRHQLVEFSSEYWVVALNMRGYGDSDKPPKVSDYTYDTLVEDVKQFILESGKSQCTLIGHDWGGAIAWGVVDAHPSLVERHVSINSPHSQIFFDLIFSDFRQFFKSWYIFFFQCPIIPEILVGLENLESLRLAFRGPNNRVELCPDDVLEGYKYYFGQEGALKYPINYYRNIFGARIPFDTGTPKRITVPTLIIWGVGDKFLSKDIPKRVAAICEDVQIKMVDGAGHFPMVEEPKHVNDLMWEYFRITGSS